MARRKHSQWSTVIAESKKREQFFKQHSREPKLPGFGLSYAFLPLPPSAGPVAYFFRRFVSFWDALREWRIQLPPRETELPQHQSELRRANETIPFRRAAAGRILAALEAPRAELRAYRELANQKSLRDNYDAAERALVDWCSEAKRGAGLPEDWPDMPDAARLRSEGDNPLDKSPRLRVAWELEEYVLPLMWAYRDPKKFFREIAPKKEWPNFDPDTIGPFQHFAHYGALGGVLHEWGAAALLNPNVRAAFDAATPEKLVHILGEADAKGAFEEGRKPGSKDRPDSKRRVDHAKRLRQVENVVTALVEKHGRTRRGSVGPSVRAIAKKRTGTSPSAVRRSMSIARKESPKPKSSG